MVRRARQFQTAMDTLPTRSTFTPPGCATAPGSPPQISKPFSTPSKKTAGPNSSTTQSPRWRTRPQTPPKRHHQIRQPQAARPLLRFQGNGNGLQIHWEAINPVERPAIAAREIVTELLPDLRRWTLVTTYGLLLPGFELKTEILCARMTAT